MQSVDNATTARTAVATAQEALDEIQGAVSRKLQGFASAAENSFSMAGRHEQARGQRAAPSVVIDLAAVVAGRISEECGVDLSGSDVATIRKLVLDFNNSFADVPATPAITGGAVDIQSSGCSSAGRGSSADRSERGGSPNDNDRDAA